MKALPLQGVRILDLTHSWAGPQGTRLMADFGAEVIRVEYVRRLCLLRGGKKENRAYNAQPDWFQVNRNKLSITLDLRQEEDRNILRDLVKISDVFIENSRTGVMEQLGFAYPDLRELRPDIIMVSMAAFGNSGPLAAYAGYGATVEALGGIQGLTAYEKTGRPQRIKEMDIINGVVAAAAILTALLYRQRTGKGQHVDYSHLEGASHATIGEHLLNYAMNGSQVLPAGNRHPHYAPQGCYRCRGTDKWVTLTVRTEAEWPRFCRALGQEEWLADPRFTSRAARMAHHDELDRLIEAWTATRTHLEAMSHLQDHGIAAGAVLDTAEINDDPHLEARGYFIAGVPGSDQVFAGFPFKFESRAGRIAWRGPDLGEHNVRVISELLGRSPKTIKPIQEEEIGTAYDPE